MGNLGIVAVAPNACVSAHSGGARRKSHFLISLCFTKFLLTKMFSTSLISGLLLAPSSSSPPPCRPSSPSHQCQFGEYEDPRCGRTCYKGPGNVCGGDNGRFGLCSSGLTCSNCNRSLMVLM